MRIHVCFSFLWVLLSGDLFRPSQKIEFQTPERKISIENIWCEKNGIAVIEAENASNFKSEKNGWEIVNDIPGFKGRGICVWRGAADSGPESRSYDTEFLHERKLIYKVSISTPGNYFIKIRNIHRYVDGDNDVWVSADKCNWGKTYDHQINEYTFDERGAWAIYHFKEGIHTIELAGRSAGFGVDRIVLFKSDIDGSLWSSPELEESLCAPSKK